MRSWVNQLSAVYGYDLKNKFQKSIHFFWNAALPHIYRSLKQMENQGWIASTIEQQSGKPNRKVYRIMDKGKKNFFTGLSNRRKNWKCATRCL